VKIVDGASTTSTYDVANQLETAVDAAGTTTFVFDANGNQQVTIEPNGNRTTNVWDYENQTTVVQQPLGALITMSYNADNRRVRKES